MAYQPIHTYYHLFGREVIVPSVISVSYKNPIFVRLESQVMCTNSLTEVVDI